MTALGTSRTVVAEIGSAETRLGNFSGSAKSGFAESATNEMLYQQHNTQWIPAGNPGAGVILVFNNGLGRGYSTVDEIAPPVDANGNYALTSGAAYGDNGRMDLTR